MSTTIRSAIDYAENWWHFLGRSNDFTFVITSMYTHFCEYINNIFAKAFALSQMLTLYDHKFLR